MSDLLYVPSGGPYIDDPSCEWTTANASPRASNALWNMYNGNVASPDYCNYGYTYIVSKYSISTITFSSYCIGTTYSFPNYIVALPATPHIRSVTVHLIGKTGPGAYCEITLKDNVSNVTGGTHTVLENASDWTHMSYDWGETNPITNLPWTRSDIINLTYIITAYGLITLTKMYIIIDAVDASSAYSDLVIKSFPSSRKIITPLLNKKLLLTDLSKVTHNGCWSVVIASNYYSKVIEYYNEYKIYMWIESNTGIDTQVAGTNAPTFAPFYSFTIINTTTNETIVEKQFLGYVSGFDAAHHRHSVSVDGDGYVHFFGFTRIVTNSGWAYSKSTYPITSQNFITDGLVNLTEEILPFSNQTTIGCFGIFSFRDDKGGIFITMSPTPTMSSCNNYGIPILYYNKNTKAWDMNHIDSPGANSSSYVGPQFIPTQPDPNKYYFIMTVQFTYSVSFGTPAWATAMGISTSVNMFSFHVKVEYDYNTNSILLISPYDGQSYSTIIGNETKFFVSQLYDKWAFAGELPDGTPIGAVSYASTCNGTNATWDSASAWYPDCFYKIVNGYRTIKQMYPMYSSGYAWKSQASLYLINDDLSEDFPFKYGAAPEEQTGKFFICFWVNPASTRPSTRGYLVSKWGGPAAELGTNVRSFLISLQTDGSIQVHIGNKDTVGTTSTFVSHGTVLPSEGSNRWYHVQVWYDDIGGSDGKGQVNIRVYDSYNGSYLGTKTTIDIGMQLNPNLCEFTLGSNSYYSSSAFEKYMDEVIIAKELFTDAEAEQIRANTFSGILTDTRIVSAYLMENSLNLGYDSRGENNLNNWKTTSSSSVKIRGSYSASFKAVTLTPITDYTLGYLNLSEGVYYKSSEDAVIDGNSMEISYINYGTKGIVISNDIIVISLAGYSQHQLNPYSGGVSLCLSTDGGDTFTLYNDFIPSLVWPFIQADPNNINTFSITCGSSYNSFNPDEYKSSGKASVEPSPPNGIDLISANFAVNDLLISSINDTSVSSLSKLLDKDSNYVRAVNR